MAKNKAIEILEKRLVNIDEDIATADNNVRVSTNKLANLNKTKTEIQQAITVLTNNLPA